MKNTGNGNCRGLKKLLIIKISYKIIDLQNNPGIYNMNK